jgi:hypothetical protein
MDSLKPYAEVEWGEWHPRAERQTEPLWRRRRRRRRRSSWQTKVSCTARTDQAPSTTCSPVRRSNTEASCGKARPTITIPDQLGNGTRRIVTAEVLRRCPVCGDEASKPALVLEGGVRLSECMACRATAVPLVSVGPCCSRCACESSSGRRRRVIFFHVVGGTSVALAPGVWLA